jgi:ATP-binding cassette subfamily B protein
MYKRYFVARQGYSDCGIACLKSLLKFYHSEEYSLEHLRIWSGTTEYGTSMAGLIQCAQRVGLTAEGFKANVKSLKEIDSPVILHVTLEDGRHHYIICYRWNERFKKFIISDPSTGVKSLSENELQIIWTEGLLLQITPNNEFKRYQFRNNKFAALYTFLGRSQMQ